MRTYTIIYKSKENGNHRPPRMVRAKDRDEAVENFKRDNPELIFISVI